MFTPFLDCYCVWPCLSARHLRCAKSGGLCGQFNFMFIFFFSEGRKKKVTVKRSFQNRIPKFEIRH